MLLWTQYQDICFVIGSNDDLIFNVEFTFEMNCNGNETEKPVRVQWKFQPLSIIQNMLQQNSHPMCIQKFSMSIDVLVTFLDKIFEIVSLSEC